MKTLENIIDFIERSIQQDPDKNISAGNIIAEGFDKEVDELRDFIKNAKNFLADYQKKLISETGISQLKIKFTGNFGYFIEVSKTQIAKVPGYFVQKQTLVNAVRYYTPEIKEFESKILNAEQKLAQREYELFLSIRAEVLLGEDIIKKSSEKNNYLDFLSNGAYIAYSNGYNKPEISINNNLEIIDGRHPVIEQSCEKFISNNLALHDKEYLHIITGPNMGGKSTFLRQNALIILLSHMGYFVSSRDVKIGIIDKIFSRIGANDNLWLGQSTFMVEMQEMSNILRNATKKSFVIVDEIGRGTSTYDGMSLAWSILQYMHNTLEVKSLFATHYHELVDESDGLAHAKSFSVAVKEENGELVFLRKIIPGGVKKSYGIEVASLAGIPSEVLNEAKKMMMRLEQDEKKSPQMLMDFDYSEVPENNKNNDLEDKIRNLDINTLTPIEAITELEKIQNLIK